MTYSDPHVPRVRLNGHSLESVPLDEAAATADCVAIITDHSAFDYASLVKQADLIVDTRNALKGYRCSNVVRL